MAAGKLRYYITAAELEEAYSVYGFKAANYHGERFVRTPIAMTPTICGQMPLP